MLRRILSSGKIVKGEGRIKYRNLLQIFFIPRRILSYSKIVKGESRKPSLLEFFAGLSPFLDPASQRGVTRYVHSSQQQEERTKKCRRCYRASSLGGWYRPRGLRNSLRSDSPRPSSSVGWPPPGPIKAGFCSALPFVVLAWPLRQSAG